MKTAILLLMGCSIAISTAASAQSVPPLINYQGRLTDQTGAALSGGLYIIQFRLWNDPTAKAPANLIWSQQQTMAVQTNGVFDVLLGASTGSQIPSDFPTFTNVTSAFASSNVFLGVTVTMSNGVTIANPSEILPRQQLLSVPFAVSAQQAGQTQLAQTLAQSSANILSPPGSVIAYMGTTAPPGWLLCDGSLVSRTNYAALFSVIGTSSGSGDGSTTFNLPDMRGIFLRGVNGSRSDGLADPDDNTTFRTNIFSGGNMGNSVGSYQADQFASHTHTTPYPYPALNNNGYTAHDGSGGFPGAMSFFQTVNATGGNETRPKNVYVNYIIKY
jgi:microcystin-dependent protein